MKKIIITFISIIVIILIVDSLIYKNNNEYTKLKDSLDKAIGSNVYEVISINKSIEILNKENGVLFYTTNKELDYIEYLNDLAKDFNIDKIYYISLTKESNNEELISNLEDNIKVVDGVIQTPMLITVKDGLLINVINFKDYDNHDLDKKLLKVLYRYYNTSNSND